MNSLDLINSWSLSWESGNRYVFNGFLDGGGIYVIVCLVGFDGGVG